MKSISNCGREIDIITVKRELELKSNHSNSVINLKLGSLTSEYGAAGVNVQFYCEAIIEASRTRSVARMVLDAQEALIGGQNADEVLAKMSPLFSNVRERSGGSPESMKSLVHEQYALVEKYSSQEGGMMGITTSYIELDSKLSGLYPGDLIIVAGRPSMGKSTFMLNMARRMAEKGSGSLLFSLEMSKMNIIANTTCAAGEISGQKLRRYSLNDQDRSALIKASDALSKLDIWVDDRASLNIDQICSTARKMHRKHGISTVFIDYMQLATVKWRQGVTREREVAEISGKLKGLAKSLNIPVVALSQLSRKNESRKSMKPMLSDLRESGAIEQDADVVMFVHRPSYYDPQDHPGEAEIIVAKQRNGPTGTVRLSFNPNLMRFDNLSLDKEKF
jgi:replicative DNA helicase